MYNINNRKPQCGVTGAIRIGALWDWRGMLNIKTLYPSPFLFVSQKLEDHPGNHPEMISGYSEATTITVVCSSKSRTNTIEWGPLLQACEIKPSYGFAKSPHSDNGGRGNRLPWHRNYLLGLPSDTTSRHNHHKKAAPA